MKIGASTLATFRDGLEESLEYFEKLGLEYAEILHQYPNDEIEALDSYNLKYTIHSPFADVNIASLNRRIRKTSINEIKKSIDLANKIDAEIVVVHPGSAPFVYRNLEKEVYKLSNKSIKELGEYGDDLGVTVTIENMPDFEGMIYKNIGELNEILDELDMYMTLDIGHGNHMRYSPEGMYFDRIKHIHIHDNNGDDDSHYALGEGSIDLKQLIDIFQMKDYNGIYMIEVNDRDSVEKSLKYLKSNKLINTSIT